MALKDTMQTRILEAAEKRFKHYGYAKTSMAEIAADLGMSPGNLYRYFPSKIDMALAIADEHHEAQFQELAAIAATDQPALERLRDLLHADMVTTYRKLEEEPRIYELATIIKSERPAWVNATLARERELLDAILRDGVANGEFDIDDVPFASEMLQSAFMKFRYPQLWSHLKLPELEREFHGVAKLVLIGLAGRTGAARNRVAAISECDE